MQRRHFLAALPAVSASAALPRAFAQGKAPVPLKFTLDYRVTAQTAPFFVALHKGYYRDEGLEVSIDVGSGSVASITRVASGAYQLGLGDISALAEFQAQNPATARVQAVYQYYNRAPFAIIGRRDRGVTAEFSSLKGKKVAAAAVESTRRVWPLVAQRQGLPADLFAWSTTEFSARDNVMVRGDVDAATYFHDSAVSLFARMPAEQLSVLRYTDAGVHLYGNAILASSALLAEQPALVAGFLRASNRAIAECLAQPSLAVAAVRQREPILDEKLELARWAITAQYLAAPDTRRHGLGDIDPQLLAQQAEQVGQAFGLKSAPSAEALFNRSLLPPLAARMVRT
ncbi:ABC transporter substrate-binding protein [Delftia sp. PS-11]|uniref:ABC transporter substrate-binding protein n=1 Tax=Delftia sp. PS-11 TaxID=2767222 RepID=UPI002453D188|nr:ABC transporter substrate-binding protein [Delftia sp. PS-11]KAJ8745849.1 ABC transporter substrate-binding protein [Delftia sp. PS-11]